MQLGEGHRQNSAVARNEHFSLASGRQVRQDRFANVRSVYRATAPLRGGFGVSGVPLFWQHLQKNSVDTVPQKLPALKCFRTDKSSGSPHRSGGMIPVAACNHPGSGSQSSPNPDRISPTSRIRGFLKGALEPDQGISGKGLHYSGVSGE